MKSILKPAVMVAFLILTIGCSTENPLCTDSFCLIPREDAEGDIIEIDESKVIALIAKETSTLNVAPTPLQPDAASLSEIVSDVAAGNDTYLNQTVIITGYVVHKSGNGAMVIHTTPDAATSAAQGAVFWVESFDNPELIDRYALNTRHTFTVTIRLIKEPEGKATWRSIWSVFSD